MKRAKLTVGAVLAAGLAGKRMKYHIMNAKGHGVSRKEMAAANTHVAFYAGCRNNWLIHHAAPDAWFSHLAVEIPGENGSNEWLEAVTDEQYGSLK